MFSEMMMSATGGGTPEISVITTSLVGIIIDTQKITSVKYKFAARTQSSDSLLINVSNSERAVETNLQNYGTNVKTISSIMSDYEDLLSLSEVIGYRYITLRGSRQSSLSQIDLQIS